jgi:hypothetical protein
MDFDPRDDDSRDDERRPNEPGPGSRSASDDRDREDDLSQPGTRARDRDNDGAQTLGRGPSTERQGSVEHRWDGDHDPRWAERDRDGQLRRYFEHRREAAEGPVHPQTDGFLRTGAKVFGTTRFNEMYRRWLKQGNAVFEGPSSPVIADALRVGRGRVESALPVFSVVAPCHPGAALRDLVLVQRARATSCGRPEDDDDDAIPRRAVLNRRTKAVFTAILKLQRGETAFGCRQFLGTPVRQCHAHRDNRCMRLRRE